MRAGTRRGGWDVRPSTGSDASGEGPDQVFIDDRHVKVQAARILEHIRNLDRHYGSMIADRDPPLATALSDAAAALDRFVGTAHGEDDAKG